GPLRPARRYPHPGRADRGDVLVATQGLGPRRRARRRPGWRLDPAGGRVRVAAEGSVRGGLPEARRRPGGCDRRLAGRAPGGGTCAMTTAEWARVSSDAFNVALFAYIAAMVLSFAYLAFRRSGFHTAAITVGVAGLTANVVSIVGRGIAAGRTP